MKNFAKIGLGLLAFGFVIAVLGAIVIRTNAPRPPQVKAPTENAVPVSVASAPAQSSASAAQKNEIAASAAMQNVTAEKK